LVGVVAAKWMLGAGWYLVYLAVASFVMLWAVQIKPGANRVTNKVCHVTGWQQLLDRWR